MPSIMMPRYSKSIERQLEDFVFYMVERISDKFKKQVILSLDKSTIQKFEMSEEDHFVDKQIGNYSKIYMQLVKRLEKKILKQFSNDAIEKYSKKILIRANKYNRERTYKSVEKALGIGVKELVAKEAMSPTINALILETAQWAKRLRDETLQDFTANTLRSMALGNTVDGILREYDKNALKKKHAATFVARNQMSNFNGILTKLRHEKIGITEGIWITSEDDKVRRCHRVRNFKKFKLNEGLYSSCDGKWLLPGTDYNCRCIYKAIIPEFGGLNV